MSSTAVHFDFQDAVDLTESSAFAAPFACEYARSKAEAESVVNNAMLDGLNATIIRARAVFGPGNNSLLPRLLEAADRNRLRRIGRSDTRLDLTCIDNLVLALILAADNGESGRVYTITNDEPVQIWPFIEKVLQQTNRPPVQRPVSRSLALQAASLCEWWHRWRNKPGEPVTSLTTELRCVN